MRTRATKRVQFAVSWFDLGPLLLLSSANRVSSAATTANNSHDVGAMRGPGQGKSKASPNYKAKAISRLVGILRAISRLSSRRNYRLLFFCISSNLFYISL